MTNINHFLKMVLVTFGTVRKKIYKKEFLPESTETSIHDGISCAKILRFRFFFFKILKIHKSSVLSQNEKVNKFLYHLKHLFCVKTEVLDVKITA